MKIIHYLDIFTRESDCGKKGKKSINTDEVNCRECLEISREEWERQVREFTGQPKINAVEGLARLKKRIEELKKRGEKVKEQAKEFNAKTDKILKEARRLFK